MGGFDSIVEKTLQNYYKTPTVANLTPDISDN